MIYFECLIIITIKNKRNMKCVGDSPIVSMPLARSPDISLLIVSSMSFFDILAYSSKVALSCGKLLETRITLNLFENKRNYKIV